MGRKVARLTILVCAGILFCGPLPAQNPAGDRADFDGKILAVFLRSAPATAFVLEKAGVKRLVDQPFLVGKCPDDPAVTGPRGRITWLAMVDVIRIVEFDNLDQLKEAVKNSEK